MFWKKTSDVAQYKGADWNNFIKKVSNCSVDEAKTIASQDTNISYFFFAREGMVLEGPVAQKYGSFSPNDAVFFSGNPWFGSAPQCDTYQKVNFGVYAEGCVYPASGDTQPASTTITQLQSSGFTSLILGLFHIGRDYGINPPQIMGDIYFNDVLIISGGKYIGDPTWPSLINGALGGDVTKVCASVGGATPWVLDFQTIQKIYGNPAEWSYMQQNFQVLKDTFPVISIIDMDCEETYDQTSFDAFCEMLVGLGFGITFCPFAPWEEQFWNDSLASQNKSNPGSVKWWNLQCYAGGNGNDPKSWANGIDTIVNTNGFILASDWSYNDNAQIVVPPSKVQADLSPFKGEQCLGGAFIWTLDSIVKYAPNNDPLQNMKDYVSAMATALGFEQ